MPQGIGDSNVFPEGIPLTLTSQSNVDLGAGAIPGSATVTGDAPDQLLVWTFPETVATGASGTVSFTLQAPNSLTPNGTVIAPVATFIADGATPAVANQGGEESTTVESAVSLRVHKYKYDPTDRPYLGQQVTYAVMVGYEEQFPNEVNPRQFAKNMGDICATPGTQALENLTVIDTLPEGAQFVSATHGGTYDAVSGTVTWALGSSLASVAPVACAAYSGGSTWTGGSGMKVTVTYPGGAFEAQPDNPTAVTNEVVATANPLGQPDQPLSSDSEASHALREGTPGAAVNKLPGYDWAVGNPLYRDVPTGQNPIYTFSATTGEPNPVRWELTDMMPCALTSPIDAGDIDCATPGFVDLNFSADRMMPELHVNYTTNKGTTGVCVIPPGTSMSDTVKRYCVSADANTPIAVADGEWITKIEIDENLPAFGGGSLFIHGTPAPNVPTENIDTAYFNPNLNVDRSDVHPWFVTAENCPVTNQITTATGRVVLPQQVQTAADNAGICGYRQIMSDPFRLRPLKAMYNPTLPGTPPAVPSVQTGETLTVDLSINRTYSGADSQQVVANSRLTPTVTELLPENLVFDEGSLQIVAKTSASRGYVDALGTPSVVTEQGSFRGEARQAITVSFPEANIPLGNTSMNKEVFVRFNVKVKDGVPAGTYKNQYLLTGEEGGPDVDTTYMVCSTGTLVDASLQPTTDQSRAVGCLAEASYIVLPAPGVKADKTVQGAHDAAPIGAPGVGRTGIDDGAQYTVHVGNTGSVDVRNIVAYDILPRVGDTLTLPGASATPRNSDFHVTLTGAVAVPNGASVQYSASDNPCRGELAGTGGGATASAPTGCENDWATSPPNDDFGTVTAIRVDFGDRVFAAGESESFVLNVNAEGARDGQRLDGIAWNNVGIAAREASANGKYTLPTEQTPVGLQVLPDVAWSKTDATDQTLLAGSEWTLAPAEGGEIEGFPLSITDCTDAPCVGPDMDAAAGQFLLQGVPWGEYELLETAAPEGYVRLVDPIAVNVWAETVETDGFVVPIGAVQNDPELGEWTLAKTSDPATGSVVAPGDTITYTLTATNDSEFAVDDIVVVDDLSDVLNHAAFGEFVGDDGGLAMRDGLVLTWSLGSLSAGETRTVTYTVTLNEDSKGVAIRNLVTGEGEVPPEDCAVEKPCVTEHVIPAEWSMSKTSDPVTGSVVTPGDTVTYSLTAVNSTQGDVNGIVITDYLEDILDDAKFERFQSDDMGLAMRSGEIITWRLGTLKAGETRTVSYTVTVNEDAFDRSLRNVVTGSAPTPPENCAEEAPCSTDHPTSKAPGGSNLATTGSGVLWPFGLGSAALLLVGMSILLNARRRR